MTSHKQKEKAEAEKIKLEFYPNSSFDEAAQNSDEAAKDNAIIHVKGIMKEVDMYKGELNPRWKFWSDVLTELENL